MTTIKKDIARQMAKLGSPVLAKESSYEWADPWATSHIQGLDTTSYPPRETGICSWEFPAQPSLEEVFITMSGNPYGDTEAEKMIQMRHFSCSCGVYKDVTIRYDGEPSEFLMALMED